MKKIWKKWRMPNVLGIFNDKTPVIHLRLTNRVSLQCTASSAPVPLSLVHSHFFFQYVSNSRFLEKNYHDNFVKIECHRGSLKRTLLWWWLNEDSEDSLFLCQGQHQAMSTKKQMLQNAMENAMIKLSPAQDF